MELNWIAYRNELKFIERGGIFLSLWGVGGEFLVFYPLCGWQKNVDLLIAIKTEKGIISLLSSISDFSSPSGR